MLIAKYFTQWETWPLDAEQYADRVYQFLLAHSHCKPLGGSIGLALETEPKKTV